MRMTYDESADAAYIYLVDVISRGEVAQTRFCDVYFEHGSVQLDLDTQGRLIGIEILGAKNVLREVPP